MNEAKAPASEVNAHKAEFWLCLARAFLTPATAQSQDALRTLLAADLAGLAQALDYPVAADIARLQAALSAWPAPEALLVLYSRLFLVPGVAHPPINMGVYFDGTLHGDTVRRLTECYRACGLEKHAALPDLPDHVAVQLEFVAWLFAAEAGGENTPMRAPDFITTFVARWAPLLQRDLARVTALCPPEKNPWLALAGILATAAQQEGQLAAAQAQPPEPSEIELLRRQYAGRMPTAEELATLRERLLAQGLAADHLDRSAAERDAEHGLHTLTPPELPKHTLRSV